MGVRSNGLRSMVAMAAVLVALLAFQALGSASAPASGLAPTGRAIGKTAFAFMGGLRTFAAAVIWNRLEPQFHDYYEGKSLSQNRWALPAINMVQLLDPQFLQSYYVASFNVYRMGGKVEGVRIARDGVLNNPKSGFMRANLAQILIVDDARKNLPEMLEQARIGMGSDMYWNSDQDLYEGLSIFRAVYTIAGDTAKAQDIQTRLDEMRASGARIGDHDHDGDGKQDH